MQDSNAQTQKKQLGICPLLVQYLELVPDPRGKRGRRHAVEHVLAIVVAGLLVGKSTLVEIYEWATSRSIFPLLAKRLGLVHGIPDPTTISRVLQKLEIRSVITAISSWLEQHPTTKVEQAYSLDGKTMNGVHNNPFRHILSLFGHTTHHTLDQEAVSHKENEIPVSCRVINRNKQVLKNKVITADALLTQKSVITALCDANAFYLLKVKANNKQLLSVLKAEFKHAHPSHQQQVFTQLGHGRDEQITVTITHDFAHCFLSQEGWQNIKYVGKLTKVGTRPQKVRGSSQIKQASFVEESFFISSCTHLTPHTALELLKGHWQIENNLHRQKDCLFLEDRHTLRSATAPQCMTFLRSLVIRLLRKKGGNMAQQTRIFQLQSKSYFDFLRKAYIF